MAAASYRLSAWVALALFSLISLLSIIDEREHRGQWEFEEKWSTATVSISFGLAVIGCGLHALTFEHFATIEGSVIALVLLAWVCAIPVIMAPNHGLAVEENIIVDANLYFASWAAFSCAFYLFACIGRERARNLFSSLSKWWLCLVVSSIVAMTGAIRIFHNKQNCNENGRETEQCNELRLGIALSVVSAAIAGTIVVFTHFDKLPWRWTALTGAVIVLILWSILVAYLTFKDGPGSDVGNLFFATWISFILSLCLTVSHAQMAASDYKTTSSTPKKKGEKKDPKNGSTEVKKSTKEPTKWSDKA